jgi:hypothetical protein
MLQRERDLRLELIDRKIATTQQRERRDRVVQMFDAQRMKAVARFETRLQELEHDRQTSVEMTPPIASCLVRVEANRS